MARCRSTSGDTWQGVGLPVVTKFLTLSNVTADCSNLAQGHNRSNPVPVNSSLTLPSGWRLSVTNTEVVQPQGLWRIEYLNTGRAETAICKQIGGTP